MVPKINDVNNQNIHTDVEARVNPNVIINGQSTINTGVNGKYLQKIL
jgi:hypothetical protein